MRHSSVLRGLAFLAAAGTAAWAFYAYNAAANRPFHDVAVRSKAEHPALIPGRTAVDAFGAGFRNAVANAYYLRAVQYVASFLKTSEYKLHLGRLYEAVTDLDPYFADVYEQGPLLLGFTDQYDQFSLAQREDFARQAVRLGEKGIARLCDPVKLAAASAPGGDLSRLATDPATADPCGTHDDVPYYLAFINYRFLKDEASAAKWYRVAAAHGAAAAAAKYMAALMEGRAGQREKSTLAFLSLATGQGGPECRATASAAAQYFFPLLKDGADARFGRKALVAFAQAQEALRERFGEDACQQHFTRALREANLLYVERADAEFFKAKKRHAADAEELRKAGFADYVPADPTRLQGAGVSRYYWHEKDARWAWGIPPKK